MKTFFSANRDTVLSPRKAIAPSAVKPVVATLVLLMIGLLALPGSVRATNIVWTNTADGDFMDAYNWSPNTVPGPGDHAFITSSGSYTITLNSNHTNQDLTLTAGTLTGSGNLYIENSMNWTGGTMSGSGTTVIRWYATLYVDSSTSVYLVERTLHNRGNAYWIGANPIYLTEGAMITNEVAALFEAQSDATLQYYGGTASRFDNAGLFRKLGGAGTTTVSGSGSMSVHNYNSGVIQVESGTLLFDCLFDNDGAVTLLANTTNRLANIGSGVGTFYAPATAVLEWGGTYTLNPGALLQGDGLYRLNGGTLTCNEDLGVQNFDIIQYGAGLNGSGTLTVSNEMNWVGGSMRGSGRTVIDGGATLYANSAINLFIEERTLENAGTVYWTGATPIYMTEGAVISNRTGALFVAQSDAELHYNGGAAVRFDNDGTFRKNGGSGTTTASAASFNNDGTVEILSGTLALSGGGTHDGDFDISTDATLDFSGGTHTAFGGSSIMGGGNLTVSGGTADLYALAKVDGTNRFSGGVANINALFIMDDNVMVVSGGTVNCGSPNSLSPGTLTLSGGTLDVAGSLEVLSQMDWTGGTMSGSGKTVIDTGATLNVDSTTSLYITECTLENAGTAYWTGASPIYMTSGAVISNRAGATFEAQNDAELHYNGDTAVRFDNDGTFRKNGGTGTTTVFGNNNFVFNNYGAGAVELQTGTLLLGCTFNTGGAVELSANTTNRMSNNGSATGTFTAPATAVVEWKDDTFSLDSGVILDGAGTYRVIGGTLTCNADISVQNFDMIEGGSIIQLDGSGTLTVGHEMNWIGGAMSGSGRTVIDAGATLNAVSDTNLFIAERTLENAGTVYWTGVTPIYLTSGAVISNRTGALFEAQNDAELHYNGGDPVRFDNAGTFRKNGGTGTTIVSSSLPFNNYGAVEIISGILAANGGYSSSSNALLSCTLGGPAPGTGYGQLQAAGTVTVDGSLSVSLSGGFHPQANDAFRVLTADMRSGTFENFYYPSNEVLMVLNNRSNAVVAVVPQGFDRVVPSYGSTESGVFNLYFLGVPESSYALDWATNLSSPILWTGLITNETDASGHVMFTITNTEPNNYFRTRRVP